MVIALPALSPVLFGIEPSGSKAIGLDDLLKILPCTCVRAQICHYDDDTPGLAFLPLPTAKPHERSEHPCAEALSFYPPSHLSI